MSKQRGRNTKAEAPRTNNDIRKFIGKNQKTDFSFLAKADPKRFGDKVFRLVTDDESHSNIADKIYLGWEVVKITKGEEGQNPLLERFLFDKDKGESATIQIPVNPNNPQMGIYGILMMKSISAYKAEEQAALNEEVRRTETGLRGGQDQAESGVDGNVYYAPNVDAHGTRGFKQSDADKLI